MHIAILETEWIQGEAGLLSTLEGKNHGEHCWEVADNTQGEKMVF